MKAGLVNEAAKAIFNETQNLCKRLVVDGLTEAAREQFVNAAVNKGVELCGGLFASEHVSDVIRDAILERGDGVQNGCARARRQSLYEGRIGSRQQFPRVRLNEAFDLAAKEIRLEERVDDRLLRNQLVADSVADGLGQPLAVPGNHALRPDGHPPELDGLARAKQHTDRQPCRSIAVHCAEDDRADSKQNLLCLRVYGENPSLSKAGRRENLSSRTNVIKTGAKDK